MHPLSSAALLEAWERGQGQEPAEQAVLLLAAASPDATPEAIARLPLGQRDRLLLTLRAWTFGVQFESSALCPACGEQVELAFTAADIWTAPEDSAPETHALRMDGLELVFRLPNSLDLADARLLEPAPGRRLLLERCLLEARTGDGPLPLDDVPQTTLSALAAEMAQLDQQSDVQLSLSCAACMHRWDAPFDIGSYFCREVEDWAPRALREVHALASAYGWREAEILSMSAWRRQRYLELLGR